jgi:hypothetical protein
LRERVAAAYATGQFTVSISFVDKVLQRISGAARQLLSTCVAAQPDAMLDELR